MTRAADDARTEAIIAAQVRAAELQQACKWMPQENFFPVMIGHMGLVFGPKLAADVVTMFEITRQEHEEMMDAMMRDPVGAGRAIQQGMVNWLAKKERRKLK